MTEYKSFGALARAFQSNLGRMEVTLSAAMEVSAIAIVIDAKEELGHYQREDMGPMIPWQELAPRTKRDRVNQGYPQNDPLLRSGDMRDSIEHQVGPMEFVVGSGSDIALYQELGTPKIPPRPFLATALYRNVPVIQHLIGEAIEETLAGKK